MLTGKSEKETPSSSQTALPRSHLLLVDLILAHSERTSSMTCLEYCFKSKMAKRLLAHPMFHRDLAYISSDQRPPVERETSFSISFIPRLCFIRILLRASAHLDCVPCRLLCSCDSMMLLFCPFDKEKGLKQGLGLQFSDAGKPRYKSQAGKLHILQGFTWPVTLAGTVSPVAAVSGSSF